MDEDMATPPAPPDPAQVGSLANLVLRRPTSLCYPKAGVLSGVLHQQWRKHLRNGEPAAAELSRQKGPFNSHLDTIIAATPGQGARHTDACVFHVLFVWVAALMSAHSNTPYITPSMEIYCGGGVVRGRRVQQLAFTLARPPLGLAGLGRGPAP